ncbi:MAG: CHAT domain-containing protein, partial [Acidobacteriota bacterium]
PSEEFGSAEELANILGSLAQLEPRVELQVLRGKEATRKAVERALTEERFDLFHFSGHGYLQIENKGLPTEQERSGLMLAGGEFLDFLFLKNLSGKPRAVILNTCQAHSRFPEDTDAPDPSGLKFFRPRTFAAKILNAGVEAFVGTRWRIHYQSAGNFASAVYRELADGASLGDGVIAGRSSLLRKPIEGAETDWANYQLYGDGRLRLVPV